MLGLYNHQVGKRSARRKRPNLTAEVLKTFDAADPQSWDCWSKYRRGMTVLARGVSLHVQQYSELVAAS
jgi:hypothetical protein